MVAQVLVTAVTVATGAVSWFGQFKVSQPAKAEAKAPAKGAWTLKA